MGNLPFVDKERLKPKVGFYYCLVVSQNITTKGYV